MRKKFTLLLSMALCVFTSSVMAQTQYTPGNRTTTLEAGKQYFVSVATYYGSACTNLLYNKEGTLAKSDLLPNAITDNAAYLFTVEEVGEGYLAYIKNSDGKYLQADNLASTEEKAGVYVIPYFEAKAVCCGNDVDACDENGNRIAYTNITAETPIISVQKNADYTNSENRNGWRYIGSLTAGTNWCTAFAFYEAVEIDAAAIEEMKTSLEAAIQSAQTLLTAAEFSAVGGDKIALQTTEPTGAGYISCTNLDPEEGNDMNFLIDGKNDTYIHTNWHNVATEKDYFDVYLGEGNGLSLFQFSEVTRSACSNDFPASIEILGSTDGVDYTPVTTVSGLPAAAGVGYKSPVIECDPSYIYLRFIVTGSNYKADRPYWHMAEFSMFTPLTLSTKSEYKGKDMVLYGLSLAVAEAQEVVSGTDLTAINAATANIEGYIAEATKVYPFTITIDDANPALYSIKSGRGEAYWYTYDATDGKIALSQYTGANEQLWFFKEVATDDYKCALQLYPATDATKAMSYQNTNSGAGTIVAQTPGTEGYTNLWLLATTNGEAPYGLQTYNKANYLSNNGGVGNKMGMWNDTPANDGGTAMYILTPSEVLQALIDKANAIVENAGATVGYPTVNSRTDVSTAATQAAAAIENKTGYSEAYVALQGALDTLETIQPDTTKFYTIVSAMPSTDKRGGQMMYINADSCMQFRPEYSDSALFQFKDAGEGKFYLYNVVNKTYLSTAKAHGKGQAEVKADSIENAMPVVITNMGRSNVVKIVPEGGAMLHAQADGSKVVGWNNDDNMNASAWIIVENIEVEKVALDTKAIEFLTLDSIVQLTATVSPDEATYKNVTWATDNDKVATVDAEGRVTSVGNGEAIITATAPNGKADTCKVTVDATIVEVVWVELNMESITFVTADSTVQLIATIVPDDATYKNIKWSSSAETVATVDDNGLVTPVGNGTSIITATAANGKSEECLVTVNIPIEVAEVKLDKAEATLTTAGATVQLTATVAPEDAWEKTITWTSDNDKVATVDQTGKVTAVADGIATITATAANGVKATCKVTVAILVEVAEITLDKESIEFVSADSTVQIVAIIAPDNATDKTITWSSSDDKVATVDAEGNVTSVANGTATITATAANGKTATCTVTVNIPEENGIDNITADKELIIYDLHGRRVTTMEKGIYIVNGKKVVVK